MGKGLKLLVLIFGIIIVDQITKGIVQGSMSYGQSISMIDGLFAFTYVKNPGAAFGMGSNANIYVRQFFFLFLPVVACFWLVYLIWTTKRVLLEWAYSLILAGAIGNLIDRFSMGYVVDFLDFYYRGKHFPAFNVADSAITIAAGLLIIDYFLEKKELQEVS